LQVPVTHEGPCVQHGSPVWPQSVHVLDVPTVAQTVFVSGHELPGQHGRPSVPQDSQKPPVQTSPLVDAPHDAPSATHWLGVCTTSQQPSLLHEPPEQQGSPGPPQVPQVVPTHSMDPFAQSAPSRTHVWFVASQQPPVQVDPVQHGPPP
jgi:hypothetical protein